MKVALRICLLGVLASCATAQPGPGALPPPRYQSDAIAPLPRLPAPAAARRDAQIAANVRRELAALGGAGERAPLPVQVRVESGIVMLSGVVPAVGRAAQAVERALTVRGTRAVVDQLQVAVLPVRDAAIERAIGEALITSPAISASRLSARSRGGEVRLRGVVASPAQRDIATNLAARVPGVHAVVDLIAVAARGPRTDRQIEAEIRELLRLDPYLAGDVPHVTVRQGVAWIAGTVGTALQRTRARSHAWVSGVRGVELDALRVAPEQREARQRAVDPPLDDRAALAALRLALWLDERVPRGSVQATVQAGIAQLRGVVPSRLSQRAAEQDARHVLGVWRVESRLRLAQRDPAARGATPAARSATPAARSATMLTRTIERQLRAQLQRYPGIDARKLELRGSAGQLVLHGRVEPLESRIIVRILERSLAGERSVHDALEIVPAGVRDAALLERALQRALWWEPRVDSSRVSVEVQGERVVVEGSLANRAQRSLVLDVVQLGAAPRPVEDRSTLSAGRGAASWSLR